MVIQSSQVIIQHPLKFRTFEELKEQDLFEPGTSNRLKKMDCRRMFDFIKSVFDKAELCHRNGEHEDAFLLYKRVSFMCEMAQEKSDFYVLKNHPDGRYFFMMFDTSLKKLTELYDSLKDRYMFERNGTLKRSPSVQSRISSTSSTVSRPTDELGFDFGTYIKPKDLVKHIDSKKSVLLIDYRATKGDENVNYPPMSVAQVPANVLAPGCIFSSLVKTVPVAERGKLNALSDYDLVVLMESTNPPTFRSGEMKQDTHASILMNALTFYNTISRPKRRPLFLDGGFENWRLHYPMFVTAETQRRSSFLDPNSQFAELLHQIRSEMLPQVEYPDLYGERSKTSFYLEDQPKREPSPILPTLPQPTPRSSLTPSSSATNIFPPPTPNTLYPKMSDVKSNSIYSNQPSWPTPKQEISVTEFPPQASAEPRVHHVPIKVVPSVPPLPDRSTKPMRPQSPFKTLEPIKPNDVTRLDNKPLPRVPSLQGGARKDFPESNGTSRAPQVPPRPVTPDRSKKIGLNHGKSIELIDRVYSNCYHDIQKNARLGNVRPGYTGLINLGNTCFMNTTLQALFNTPQLQQIFKRSEFMKYINENNTKGTKGIISACFSSLMDCVWSGKFIAIRPELFLNAFADTVCADLADRRQHDAQEFQIFLLNALHEDTNKVTKPESFEQNYDGHDLLKNAEDYKLRQNRFASSPVNDVFNLRTVSQLQCGICLSTSVTFEEMNQISVELPQGTPYAKLNECLSKHFSEVFLEGQNKWNCPKCKKPQLAKRSTQIWQLPSVLVVHLKRFSLSGGTFVKNEMMIDFEASGPMHMGPYLHDKALNQKAQYTLYAITNHDGTLNSGHYTSFIRNRLTHEWLKFDDDYCTPISSESLKSKKAYILYYTNQPFFNGHHQL